MQSPVLSPTPPNHTAQSPLLLDAPVSPSTIGQIVTNIPSRLDTLPFSFWHVRVILALGASWILDGVLVTNISLISAALRSPETLHLSDVQIGSLGTAYLIGSMCGSLLFGRLSDRFGRRRIFFITPTVYSLAVGLMSLSFHFVWMLACLLLAGIGIGGEYSSLNSAVNEFLPRSHRGTVDIIINGSYWIGACIAASLSLLLLNPRVIPINWGWRLPFLLGLFVGATIIILRCWIPESPRWLLGAGRAQDAEHIVASIETRLERRGYQLVPLSELNTVEVDTRGSPGLLGIFVVIYRGYVKRAILSLVLMSAQSFAYNSLFFSLGLVLSRHFDVPSSQLGLYLIPFAASNFFGAALLAKGFDAIGRKPMITSSFTLAGLLLLGTGVLFVARRLTSITITVCWAITWFFLSPGASASYLTVAEVFPLKIRALAIAMFFSLGNLLGAIGPSLFGFLNSTGGTAGIFYGYLVVSCVLLLAAFVELLIGVKAENRGLEEVSAQSSPHPFMSPSPQRDVAEPSGASVPPNEQVPI